MHRLFCVTRFITLTCVFAAVAVTVTVAVTEKSGSSYVAVDQTELLDQSANQTTALLYIAAEVAVIEEHENVTEVELEAWAELDDDGSLRTDVYSNSTDRILVASLETPEAAEVEGEENGWAMIRVAGQVSSDNLNDDLNAIHAPARDLYEAHCAACHIGYAPSLDRLISSREPRELYRRRAHARESGMSTPDLNLLMHWLQSESKALRESGDE